LLSQDQAFEVCASERNGTPAYAGATELCCREIIFLRFLLKNDHPKNIFLHPFFAAFPHKTNPSFALLSEIFGNLFQKISVLRRRSSFRGSESAHITHRELMQSLDSKTISLRRGGA
jgi:hypothetical protein